VFGLVIHNRPENRKDTGRADQAGGLRFERRPLAATEVSPPSCGVRIVHLTVEQQHELRLPGLVFAKPVAQQRDRTGGLANGTGPQGFVGDGLPDLLFHEVQEIEDEGYEFSVSGGCHIGWIRRFEFDAERLAAQGFTWVAFPRKYESI
jgi:hypothetical protein